MYIVYEYEIWYFLWNFPIFHLIRQPCTSPLVVNKATASSTGEVSTTRPDFWCKTWLYDENVVIDRGVRKSLYVIMLIAFRLCTSMFTKSIGVDQRDEHRDTLPWSPHRNINVWGGFGLHSIVTEVCKNMKFKFNNFHLTW